MGLTREQKLLAIGFLGATGVVIAGLDHWLDLVNPKVFGGLVVQLSIMARALYTEPKA